MLASRPRAGVPVPFLCTGLRPFGGGETWCLPGEDLAGQALSAMTGSRWASLESGPGLLARGAPCFRGRASAAGSGGPLPGLSDLELPGRLLLAGVGWVGAASRQAVHPGPGCLYFKTCCPLRARQLWVCSMLLLTAAAVGATQPSAAKMRLDPPPPSVLFGLARPPVTSAEKRTVARLQSIPPVVQTIRTFVFGS